MVLDDLNLLIKEETMFTEFDKVRQEKDGFRRLFTDKQLQLYVWYTEKGGEIYGFQLLYMHRNNQKALTWTKEEGFLHSDVDGWDSSGINSTPFLVSGGQIPFEQLKLKLQESLQGVEQEIQDLILPKYLELGKSLGFPET